MIRISRETKLYSLVEKDRKNDKNRSPMINQVQIVNKFRLLNKNMLKVQPLKKKFTVLSLRILEETIRLTSGC